MDRFSVLVNCSGLSQLIDLQKVIEQNLSKDSLPYKEDKVDLF